MSESEKIIYSMVGVSKFHNKKPILKDISLSYFYGAKIGVLGLNGSGKSSLLRILAGVDTEFEGETILSTNNQKKPFNDIRVRQAIAHAINSQEIIEGAMFGFGTPIGSHFAPHHAAYIDLTGAYPHDVNRSKKLLAEAGLANGFEATLKLPPPSYARRGGEIVASQLRKVGINLEIIPVEWAQWLDQVFKNKDFDLTIVSHTEPMDIGIYSRPNYYFQYHNSAFNSVIKDLNITSDPKKRYALMGAAQAILSKDAVNGFLFQLAKLGIWNKNVVGLWKNSPVQANDLTSVSWKN